MLLPGAATAAGAAAAVAGEGEAEAEAEAEVEAETKTDQSCKHDVGLGMGLSGIIDKDKQCGGGNLSDISHSGLVRLVDFILKFWPVFR